MLLYDLGSVSWLDSQLVYHALPRLGREALVLCRPASPYASIGYHQDLLYELDLSYCEAEGIPVFRREVGGGAVFLDRGQIFYQIVLRRGNPLVPLDRGRFFRKFLAPVAATLEGLGLAATLEPACDLHVGGRKISGNGAGELEGFVVLVGNLLVEIDFGRMAGILRLPCEAARSRVRRAMEEKLTSLALELDSVPAMDALAGALARSFGEALPQLEPAAPDSALDTVVRELGPKFLAPGWLFEPGRAPAGRRVKIAEGTYVDADAA
ncbi:MAG: lipoate--protein ligase family protein [Deltaproteobacteria bacterium]|nr:lipoate--protein ligase family protein [Deltaproteobacteria bacterium]